MHILKFSVPLMITLAVITCAKELNGPGKYANMDNSKAAKAVSPTKPMAFTINVTESSHEKQQKQQPEQQKEQPEQQKEQPEQQKEQPEQQKQQPVQQKQLPEKQQQQQPTTSTETSKRPHNDTPHQRQTPIVIQLAITKMPIQPKKQQPPGKVTMEPSSTTPEAPKNKNHNESTTEKKAGVEERIGILNLAPKCKENEIIVNEKCRPSV